VPDIDVVNFFDKGGSARLALNSVSFNILTHVADALRYESHI
jgi:hypothetical protein